MAGLEGRAELIKAHNAVNAQIAAVTGRPAERGHTGEYLAAHIFGIELQESAAHKAIDGQFSAGSLAGRTVNVKWYGKQDGLLDVSLDPILDYYLVMTGPKGGEGSSRGAVRPWVIAQVFLIDAAEVRALLLARGGKLDNPVSIPSAIWQASLIYPVSQNDHLPLTDQQRADLALFAPTEHKAQGAKAEPMGSLPPAQHSYRVLVDDNFHYRDESERYEHGQFDTCESAIAACKRIVDEFLADAHKAGMTAGELWQRYAGFGDAPFIATTGPQCAFSAWDYARQRCDELGATNR
jgi:hypothetical protein